MHEIAPTPLTGDDLSYHYQKALSVVAEAESVIASGDDILLNLSTAEWFNPAFLAPISVLYNQASASEVSIQVEFPNNHHIEEYLHQISFPEGTTNPTESYEHHLPLCSMRNDSNGDNIVETVGEKIWELLKQRFGDDLSASGLDWIHYPITEIIDNVDTHSNCNYGALIVQDYPNKDFLDICIADNGISIPGSYEYFGIDFDSNPDAVLKAMREGISTRPDTGYERGFGLRTTTEMVCDGLQGCVILSSRDAAVIRRQNQDPRIKQTHSWSGTVFIARLHHPEDSFRYTNYIYPD